MKQDYQEIQWLLGYRFNSSRWRQKLMSFRQKLPLLEKIFLSGIYDKMLSHLEKIKGDLVALSFLYGLERPAWRTDQRLSIRKPREILEQLKGILGNYRQSITWPRTALEGIFEFRLLLTLSFLLRMAGRSTIFRPVRPPHQAIMIGDRLDNDIVPR